MHVKDLDKKSLEIRKANEREIAKSIRKINNRSGASEQPKRFILKTGGVKQPKHISYDSVKNKNAQANKEPEYKAERYKTAQYSVYKENIKLSESKLSEGAVSITNNPIGKERFERMEIKRKQFIEKEKKIKKEEYIDKRIGVKKEEVKKEETKKDNKTVNNSGLNLAKRKQRQEVSQERLERMQKKRKEADTDSALRLPGEQSEERKTYKSYYTDKESSQDSSKGKRTERIDKKIGSEKKDDYYKGADPKKEGKELYTKKKSLSAFKNKKRGGMRRIGKEALSGATDASRKVKNEVLNNVDGGDDINQAVHYGVSVPVSTGRKAYKLVKESADRAKIRKQKREIKKDIKRREREIYAKLYAERDNETARKELRRIKKTDKKFYKKSSGKDGKVKAKPGLTIASTIGNFMKSEARKTLIGTNSHAESKDPGQRGAYALMSAFSPLAPFRIVGKLIEIFSASIKIFIIAIIAIIILVVVLAGGTITMIKSSPIGIVIDAAEFFSNLNGGGNDTDEKQYVTKFTKDKFSELSTKIQNELNTSGENRTVTVNYNKEEGIDKTNLADILAVFSVKYCQNGEFASGELDAELEEKIKEVFEKAVTYSRDTETYTEAGNTTEAVRITVTMKNWKTLADEYSMSEEDKKFTEEIYDMIKDSIPDSDVYLPISGNVGSYVWVGDGEATEIQLKIAENAKLNNGWYPANYGYCAQWVAGIYANSGATRPHGNAIDYWVKWGKPEQASKSNVPIGAAVITTGDSNFGHIGIYIGNGMVASNLGGVKIEPLATFGDSAPVYSGYETSMHGKQGYLGWVWPDGIALGPTPSTDVLSSGSIDPSKLSGEWKTGIASAYGGYQDASVRPGALTYNESPCTESSMGVAVPMSLGKEVYDSLMGHKVLIEYNGKVVEATINDIGNMGGGSRVLDLQPGVFKSFGYNGARDWGLRTVRYKIL